MAVTALAGAATSCGIPVSGSPTVLAANAIPDCLLCIRPPFKPHPEKGKPPAGYYLVFMVANTEALIPVIRQIPGRSVKLTAEEAIDGLMRGPLPSESATGILTDLPSSSVDVTGPNPKGIVTIDLGNDFPQDDPPLAFAQMVWTVSQVAGVKGTQFFEFGHLIQAPDFHGNPIARPVQISDYRVYFTPAYAGET